MHASRASRVLDNTKENVCAFGLRISFIYASIYLYIYIILYIHIYISTTVPSWHEVECLQCPVIPKVCPWPVLKELGSPFAASPAQGSGSLFPSNFQSIFHLPKCCPTNPKRGLKGKLDTIFYRLGGTGGNVKTMVLCTRNHNFLNWRGVPRDLFCSTLRTMFSNVLLGATFVRCFTSWPPEGSRGRTREAPTNHLFGYIFHPASFRDPWIAQCRQNTSQHNENDSKIYIKMTFEGARTTSQRLTNGPNHSSNNSVGQWIHPGTVAGSPQAVGYIYGCIYMAVSL